MPLHFLRIVIVRLYSLAENKSTIRVGPRDIPIKSGFALKSKTNGFTDSAPNQAFCNVSALEGGTMDTPDDVFIADGVPGREAHISHPYVS